MVRDDQQLPVIQEDLDQDTPSCSPSIYVSNEEAVLLARMRELRDRSLELRQQLKNSQTGQRENLESEIESLRVTWKDLAARREQAFVRKMIMLGHLPPDHPNR